MTKHQKTLALAAIKLRIEAAERNNLESTARSFRELYANVAARPAHEIICARDFSKEFEAVA